MQIICQLVHFRCINNFQALSNKFYVEHTYLCVPCAENWWGSRSWSDLSSGECVALAPAAGSSTRTTAAKSHCLHLPSLYCPLPLALNTRPRNARRVNETFELQIRHRTSFATARDLRSPWHTNGEISSIHGYISAVVR